MNRRDNATAQEEQDVDSFVSIFIAVNRRTSKHPSELPWNTINVYFPIDFTTYVRHGLRTLEGDHMAQCLLTQTSDWSQGLQMNVLKGKLLGALADSIVKLPGLTELFCQGYLNRRFAAAMTQSTGSLTYRVEVRLLPPVIQEEADNETAALICTIPAPFPRVGDPDTLFSRLNGNVDAATALHYYALRKRSQHTVFRGPFW